MLTRYKTGTECKAAGGCKSVETPASATSESAVCSPVPGRQPSLRTFSLQGDFFRQIVNSLIIPDDFLLQLFKRQQIFIQGLSVQLLKLKICKPLSVFLCPGRPDSGAGRIRESAVSPSSHQPCALPASACSPGSFHPATPVHSPERMYRRQDTWLYSLHRACHSSSAPFPARRPQRTAPEWCREPHFP